MAEARRVVSVDNVKVKRKRGIADTMFTAPVKLVCREGDVAPLRSIDSYRSDQEALSEVNRLREAGLTEDEVEMVLQGGKKRGVAVEPVAIKARMTVIHEKLSEYDKRLRNTSKEVEEQEMKSSIPVDHMQEMIDKERDTIQPLPIQVIERNRITVQEIQQMPHFTEYTPGSPSSTLYIKNIHRKTSLDDLKAIFGHWNEGVWPKVRLLTGRLGGQAFAEFKDVGVASQVLHIVNGYMNRNKPLIISYGHQ